MKRVLILFLSLLFLFGAKDVLALEYIGEDDSICTETQLHKQWAKLSPSVRKTIPEPVRCQEMTDVNKKFKIQPVRGTNPWEQSSFDLRNVNGNNYVTPVKNQEMVAGVSDSSLCWSFATMAAIESNYLLRGGSILDLSERHLGFSATRHVEAEPLTGLTGSLVNNPYGYRNHTTINGEDSGGTYLMSGTYLAQGRGPVLESRVPFSETVPTVSNSYGMKADFNVGQVLYHFGDTCGDSTDVLFMKYLIATRGAITSLMYGDSFDDTYVNNYYNGSELYNHAITIVGWDDSYAKENFKVTPPGNGAWIIKDTYPRFLGNATIGQGYHYMSYYDKYACMMNLVVDDITDKVPDKGYYYDNLGINAYMEIPEGNTIYFKEHFNKFNPDAEVLDRVNMYMSVGDNAKIYVGTVDDMSQATYVGNYTSEVEGYVTIDFTEPVTINGSNIYLFVKYTSDNGDSTNGYSIPVYVDYTSDSTSMYAMSTLPSNSAFYGPNGNQWIDTTSVANNKFFPLIHLFSNALGYNLMSSAPAPSTESTISTEDVGAYYYIPLTVTNIDDLNDITVQVYNSQNVNVSDKFNIVAQDNGYNIGIKDDTPAGTYTVMFNYRDLSTSQTIVVTGTTPILVTGITITGEHEISVRGTMNLTASVTPSDADDTRVVWSSSDEEIATVDENGVVRGVKAGTVTITATAMDEGHVNATHQVTVVDINVEEGGAVTDPETPIPKDSTPTTTDTSTTAKDENPSTGVTDYILYLVIVAATVGVVYLVINRKKYFYNI